MKCQSLNVYYFFFLLWRCDPTLVIASSFLRFLDHTQRRTTVGRTPLDEWSACRRDLYPTTHNTHNRQISMLSVGFEPTISVGERPQTYALDLAATGTGECVLYSPKFISGTENWWNDISYCSRACFKLTPLPFHSSCSLYIFRWHNPSGHTMALGSTHPLTEMSTTNIS